MDRKTIRWFAVCLVIAILPAGVWAIRSMEDKGASSSKQSEQGISLMESMDKISFDAALELLQEKNTDAVLFFGFQDCPHCQLAADEVVRYANKQQLPLKHVETRDHNHQRLYTDVQKEKLEELVPGVLEKSDGENVLFVPCVLQISKGSVANLSESFRSEVSDPVLLASSFPVGRSS